MKWLGQYIQDLTARFRDDVYLESISTGTIASGAHLGLDSNNKIVKAVDGGGDLTSIVAGTGLSGTSLTGPDVTLNVDATQAGITGLGTITSGTWQSTTAVIASAYLDADTAHLSGNQTFTGGKKFSAQTIFDGDKNVTPGDGAVIHVDAHDITDTNTSGSGTAAMYTHVNIENPRLLAANSSVTTTAAASLYIKGAPTASTNQTITNAYSLWAETGNVKFGGALTVDGTITGTLGTATQPNITTLAGVSAIGSVDTPIVVTSDTVTFTSASTVTFTSASADDPTITIKNTSSGTDDMAMLNFVKDRGTAPGVGDNLAEIRFFGEDSGQNEQEYGRIFCETDVVTDGQESGKLSLGVANHDGGNGYGLILTGGSLDNEIDVTIGLGAASVVTTPGSVATTGVSVASAATTGNAIFVDCNSLTTGSAINLDIDDATTGSNEKNLLRIDYDKAGVIADGEDSTITGLDISMIDAATNHSGSALGMTGAKIVVDSASTQGSNSNTGLIVQVTDATANTGISLNVEDGGSDIRMASSADASDVCVIATTTNGATSITTVDGGSDNAHLSLAVDGDFSIASTGIDIAANGTITNAVWNGTKITDIYTNSSGKRYGNTIKILPSDFMINDDAASPLSFKDGANSGVHVNDAASEAIAFVTIPEGMTATLVDVYGTHNRTLKVWEVNVHESFDFTSSTIGTGALNTQLNITDTDATEDNYLAIQVTLTATSQRIWGGRVTIASQ